MIQVERHKPAAVRITRSDPVNILVFLIPCLQFVRLQLIGTLYGPPICCYRPAFIVLAFRGKISVASPVSKRFLFFGCLWLASQCVTDIVRHTAFVDYARGWSNIGMTLVKFLCALDAIVWKDAADRDLRVGVGCGKSSHVFPYPR